MSERAVIPPGAKIFRYRLDFYYQQALLYLVTLVLYAGVRGTFDFKSLPTLVVDPLLYIIILFVVISFVVLVLNKMRDRKLIVGTDRIIFHHRYRDREVPVTDIEWFHVGRERAVQTAGRSQVIMFKTRSRLRVFRIRVGRYEKERELMEAMERFGAGLPKRKKLR